MTPIATICTCGHQGEEHASNEPRVCKSIDCSCFLFSSQDVNYMPPDIDKVIRSFKTWSDRFEWLGKNCNFIFGFTNTEIIFWYWKHVYPKWDAETEFLFDTTKKSIMGGAKPESITRAFRLAAEKHPEWIEAYGNTTYWKRIQEEGHREGAIALK